MKVKLPHIPRIITAVIFPSFANLILWAAMASLIGYNFVLASTKPIAYSDKVFGIFAHPNSPLPHENLAQLLWKSGVRALAKQELAIAGEFSPVLGAETSVNDQREAAQIKFWQDAAANHPDWRDAYIQLAALSYAQGNLLETKAYLTKASALDPNGKATHDLLEFVADELAR